MLQADLLAAQNVERSRAGKVLLGTHTTLQRAAQGHADWMARVQRLSHTGEGRSDFVDRIRAAGEYPSQSVAENIAYAGTIQQCVDMWMRSGGHRANMLNGNYRSTGCGASLSGSVVYVCAVYGAAAPSEVIVPPPEPVPSPPRPRTWWEIIVSFFRKWVG